MPSTRYSFSCHTKEDKELIEWLDSFPTVRQRNQAIKDKLLSVGQNKPQDGIDRESIEQIMKMLERVLREISNMRFVETTSDKESDELSAEDEQTAIDNLLGALD